MIKKLSLPKIALLQALGLAGYFSLVGLFMYRANDIFGKMNTFLGPMLFLGLFSFSAMVCGLITFTIPFRIFWDEKNTKKAIRLVFYTAAWLGAFVALGFIVLLLNKA